MADYYQILEVPPDASQETIKEQYRFLVQAWHPDKFSNPSQKIKAEEKIKDINAAYQTLSNPTKREEYNKKYGFSRSSSKQKYREPAYQPQSEDERRRKEESARRAKEEQLRRERADRERKEAEKLRAKEEQLRKARADRERKEAEKLRAENERKERITWLDQEISLLNQQIGKLSQGLPKMPNPIFSTLLIVGGIYGVLFAPAFHGPENSGLFLFIFGASVIIGIGLLIYRNRFYEENYKPTFDEIEKRKQYLEQLVRERLYLK